MEPAVEIDSVCFSYGRRPVLRDICFQVSTGSLCGLLGPNASGKTTLLKCVDGVLTPEKGAVRVRGKAVKDMSRQEVARLVAVVPQQTNPVFAFTSLQMVVMGRAARLGRLSLPSRLDKRDAEKSLDELGIAELGPRPFSELSGGERQLVLLSRALFQDTPILLLDEPTSHLDFRNQFMIMDAVESVTKRKRLSTIVTLHDPNLAARYCTHLVLLRKGVLFREGSREAVFDAGTLKEVYGIDVVVERTGAGAEIVLPQASSLPADDSVATRHGKATT